ncbi:unnamed protein product [Dibothriocephalus latus]|uniref:Uncharacterized protein n=1 Tax=Dibothriocephalus latus TaxID=60516 RepID=A0A3P7M653_DIBLA|nr:unnamed protein product [Dibothriocephalus latus]
MCFVTDSLLTVIDRIFRQKLPPKSQLLAVERLLVGFDSESQGTTGRVSSVTNRGLRETGYWRQLEWTGSSGSGRWGNHYIGPALCDHLDPEERLTRSASGGWATGLTPQSVLLRFPRVSCGEGGSLQVAAFCA